MSTLKETPFQLKMKIKRLQIGCKYQLRIHMSRHTFGTLMLSAGIPIESISKMMGHTNIRTTQIYARVTDNKISNSVQASIIYAEDADVLNVAMFGMTAKQWREANPDLKGNIRDYATINELICLSNMENINAVLINDGVPQGERLMKLNQIAIQKIANFRRERE